VRYLHTMLRVRNFDEALNEVSCRVDEKTVTRSCSWQAPRTSRSSREANRRAGPRRCSRSLKHSIELLQKGKPLPLKEP
jgi:hypothetical protein